MIISYFTCLYTHSSRRIAEKLTYDYVLPKNVRIYTILTGSKLLTYKPLKKSKKAYLTRYSLYCYSFYKKRTEYSVLYTGPSLASHVIVILLLVLVYRMLHLQHEHLLLLILNLSLLKALDEHCLESFGPPMEC